MDTLTEISNTKQRIADRSEATVHGSIDAQNSIIACHACEHRNSATQKYCSKCGQLLWEPCVVCQTSGPVGQVYCGSCGAHMETARLEKAAQISSLLAEAKRLRDESAFQDAIDILQDIVGLHFSCVAAEVQQAKQLFNDCLEARCSAAAHGERLADQARRHLQQYDFRAAVKLLQGIPATVRSSEIQTLLDESQSKLDELDRLCREVEREMKSRINRETAAKLNRILELQPGHGKAQRWARKLKQQLCLAAREKIKHFRYDKAEELLRCIPASEIDQKSDIVRKEMADLADMQWVVHSEPFIDEQLQAIAALLLKRVPNHPRAADWLKNMRACVQKSAGNYQRGLPCWAPPPQQPRLGCPIDRPTGFRNFEVNASCAATLCRKQAGRFYAACGLALQGLERASIAMNMLPDNRGGILRHLSRLRRSHQHVAAWGLDMGSSSIKAVKLAWNGQWQNPRIEACHLIEFPKNLEDVVDAEQKAAWIGDALKTFRHKYSPQNECLAVGLPGRQMLYRLLELPVTNDKKRATAVQYEARRLFPLPLAQLVLNYQPLDGESQPAAAAEHGKQTILLAAAKRSFVEEQLELFAQADLTVDVLQSDSLALLNHFHFDGGRPEHPAQDSPNRTDNAAVAVFDFGGSVSNFLVRSPSCAWFHASGLGANKINQGLMRRFGTTAAEAESLKRRPVTAQSLRQWHEAVEPVFEDIAHEISWSMDMFAKAHPEIHISRILVTGGGFQTHGLLRYLYHGR